jgi:metallophosphoesterase superfamily enzyme
MKNILLFGDLHLTKQDIPECISILEEIGMLANQHNVDTLIDLGDTFDNLKPSSLELDNFATFIRRLNKKIIIIAAESHESETPENSIVNHFGILSDTITVVKEYQDENKLYCGHFIVSESQLNKFGATISKNQLKKYRHVILGHGHSFELIKPNICQLGSSRWIDFSEAQDKNKIILLIENYDSDNPKCSFIALKSPYKMIDIILEGKNNEKNL